MADLDDELAGLLAQYGQAVPPLPRQPRISQYTVRMDTLLFEYLQKVANDRRFGYSGDIGALIRHLSSLGIMALARSVGDSDGVSPLKFQMEMLKRQQDEEAFRAFADFSLAMLKDAEEAVKIMGGRTKAAVLLGQIIGTIRTHPAKQLRVRMEEFILGNERFITLAQKLGDEELRTWLEIAM